MSETATTLQPVWRTKLSIDTAPTGGPTWSELRAGIENIEEAVNDQTKQYFFMGDEGFAHNEVNGMAPTFTLSGRRVMGDAAQDYIDGKKYATAEERKTRVKLESSCTVGSTTKTVTVTCPATMTAISTIGGATTDNSAFSVTFSLNGKPERTEA